jgi:RNA polymerase sigma-70 factor (ECF subfamily)
MNAFLYKTARNLLVDYYRKKGKIQFVSTDNMVLEDMKTSLHDQIALSSDVDSLKKQMKRLNDDYQNVLIWHYVEDIPVSEIALLLGKSENNTRVLLSRALQALREKVQES